MGRKFPPGTLCIYCGVANATTIDHVPPKCPFAKGNRGRLVRVPSCTDCNNGFSRDDEFFRHVLHLRKDVFDLPEAREARDSTLRALGRKDHRGLRQTTARNTSIAPKWNGSIYSGISQYLTYDSNRLSRVASRAVYGLWWEAFQERLPDDYLCFAMETTVWEKGGSSPENYIVDVATARVRTYLDDQQVCFVATEQNLEDPFTTRWFLGFYGKAFFSGFTLPKVGIDKEVLGFIQGLDCRRNHDDEAS